MEISKNGLLFRYAYGLTKKENIPEQTTLCRFFWRCFFMLFGYFVCSIFLMFMYFFAFFFAARPTVFADDPYEPFIGYRRWPSLFGYRIWPIVPFGLLSVGLSLWLDFGDYRLLEVLCIMFAGVSLFVFFLMGILFFMESKMPEIIEAFCKKIHGIICPEIKIVD